MRQTLEGFVRCIEEAKARKLTDCPLWISTCNRACRQQSRIVGIRTSESRDCAFESGTRRVKPYVVLIASGATVSSLTSRQAVAPKSIASTLAAASSCMCGRT